MAKDPDGGKGELVAKSDVPVAVGAPTVRQEKAWINTQIPYENFAGRSEELDNLAVTLVRSHVNSFRMRMSGPMRRWAVNWQVANGDVPWLQNDDDIHIYESQKALTSKVARVEESILQFDPPFELESNQSDISRREAKILSAWTHRQMENANWQGLIQPIARFGELTNHLAIKVSHDRRKELVVDTSSELIDKGGRPYWRNEKRMRTAVVRRGVRYDAVDPFMFFYDLEAKEAQECSFIGDESEPLLHQVIADAELGLYSKSQVDKVSRNRSNGDHKGMNSQWADSRGGGVDYDDGSVASSNRGSRSIAQSREFGQEESSINDGSVRCRMIEAYEYFDFGRGFRGVTDPLGRQLKGVHRVLITIVDNVCVRMMLNPHDRKIVPYAFSRVNNNGAAAVAPATWDSVTQMNAHFDRFGSNVMRWIDLLVSPIVVTSDGSTDLPKNMLSARAGSVFRNTGAWDFMKTPDITTSVGQLMQMFRREMEETSGALRVFEGAPGTATETERKVQEQQRSARASFRASSDLWEQVALLTQCMSAQFSTVPERFAAVGKAAHVVGSYATITPDLMQRDVRFRMIGMKNLHVLGTRQTGMAQWATTWGPLLPQMPTVNLNALAKLDFELRVGRAGADIVFQEPESPWESWSQKEENAILLSGQQVEVHPLDNDEEHIRDLIPLIKRTDLADYIRQLLLDHLGMHFRSAETKRAQQAAARQQAESAAQLLAPTGGQPGEDRPPSYGGMPAKKDQGVTPGPAQSRTSAKTGRSGSGTSQSQAMGA